MLLTQLLSPRRPKLIRENRGDTYVIGKAFPLITSGRLPGHVSQIRSGIPKSETRSGTPLSQTNACHGRHRDEKLAAALHGRLRPKPLLIYVLGRRLAADASDWFNLYVLLSLAGRHGYGFHSQGGFPTKQHLEKVPSTKSTSFLRHMRQTTKTIFPTWEKVTQLVIWKP